MAREFEHLLPVWAPRLPKSLIERLYNSFTREFLDKELIDEVGFSLLVRCKSMLEVQSAILGKPLCPRCKTAAKKSGDPTCDLECKDCGWKCPWKAYQKTYQRKGLFAGGMTPFVHEYVEKFEQSRSHSDRLVLIDTLIHRFHYESVNSDKTSGRPGATSLIEGQMKDIIPFLDRLNYGDRIPPEIRQNRKRWRKRWSGNPWSQGRGQ